MRERLAALVVACLFVLLGRNGRAGVAWDDEVRFMLHIRVGQTLSPRKLKVLRKDTAFEASPQVLQRAARTSLAIEIASQH